MPTAVDQQLRSMYMCIMCAVGRLRHAAPCAPTTCHTARQPRQEVGCSGTVRARCRAMQRVARVMTDASPHRRPARLDSPANRRGGERKVRGPEPTPVGSRSAPRRPGERAPDRAPATPDPARS